MSKKILLSVFITISISILFITNLYAGSLVAYWSFEEVDADILIDHSGTGNDGQVNGDPEWVDGPFGKAMEFDGVDDFVLVPNHESYNFTQDDSFTISLWINYQPKGDWQGPLQKFNGGYPFKVEVDTANQLYFAIYDGANFPQTLIGDVREEWHHCGCVRDVDAGKLFAYLDGELAAEAQDTTSGEIANAADLYIGARKPGNTITYVGMLDEIAIYNRVLTEDEIVQAANGKLPEVNLAVENFHKLSTTWGGIRKSY
jgi:hypothetical protein